MMTKRSRLFRNYPLFIALLPVFFVLHGYRENYGLVPPMDGLLLTGLYVVVSFLLFLIFLLLFRNWRKAALGAFLLMSIHFFFGAVHDGLRKLMPEAIFVKYVFILPLLLVLIVIAIVWLKKTKRDLIKSVPFLNIVLLLLILIDAGLLISKMTGYSNTHRDADPSFVSCPDCPKPDIYLIIADEYPGQTELKDMFDFDNSRFIGQLDSLGFHTIPYSFSNYNLTPYSVASILEMDYLQWPRGQPKLAHAYETIGNSRILKFAKQEGYQFFNHSYFDFKDQPAPAIETFLPFKTRLITSQTLLSRIQKEVSYHLVTTLKWKKEIRKTVYYNKENNRSLFSATVNLAGEKMSRPKFVYTHLMMPHYPYYFDRNGNEYPFEQVIEGNQNNDQHFIEYLQYTNGKLAELIESILHKSARPPIIVLLGDHGFRHFKKPQARQYYFSNLVSVYLPGKEYASFTDTISNVNVLRTVLNASFKQHLSYLADTTFIMDNQ